MPKAERTDNLQMRIYLETIEEITGKNGLKSILNYKSSKLGLDKYIDNFPPGNDNLDIPVDDLKNLYHSLIDLFGHQGARGLQLRVGKEVIRRALEGLSRTAKALQLAARFVPETKKMRLALEKFVDESNQRWISGEDMQHTELLEEDDYFLIVEKDCFFSEDITSGAPVCTLYAGELGYLMEWITGRPHKVEEIECRALGGKNDVFKIYKSK